MKYLIDTNTIIRFLNGRAPNVRAKMSSVSPTDLAVSTIVVAKLRYGAAKSVKPAKPIAVQDQLLALVNIISFDGQAAERYGTIRVALERLGTPVGANDLLIAATAMANRLTLVTHNTGEFGRVVGLAIEDWE